MLASMQQMSPLEGLLYVVIIGIVGFIAGRGSRG